tara:strand:+ start:90030 stop:90485 length:456 start_codon:yes stop_codon:yes gene_type:complete
MKNNNYRFLIILFVFSFFFRQTTNAQSDNYNTQVINQYFQGNNISSNILKENKRDLENILEREGNSYIINQEGSNNLANIISKNNDSQSISQFGDSNEYQFINYYSNLPSKFDITQNGNSNSLQIHGENSLIKNIKIVQNTNFKTLIITNY